jgi:hypothetical protein
MPSTPIDVFRPAVMLRAEAAKPSPAPGRVNQAANRVVIRPFGGIGIYAVAKQGERQGLEEILRIKGA